MRVLWMTGRGDGRRASLRGRRRVRKRYAALGIVRPSSLISYSPGRYRFRNDSLVDAKRSSIRRSGGGGGDTEGKKKCKIISFSIRENRTRVKRTEHNGVAAYGRGVRVPAEIAIDERARRLPRLTIRDYGRERKRVRERERERTYSVGKEPRRKKNHKRMENT